MRETTRHREAFSKYWQLGADRSIERLRDALSRQGRAPALRTLYSWSSAFGWRARIDALEAEARAADDDAHVEELRALRERQQKAALFLQHKGVSALEAKRPDEISAATAVRALDAGLRIERATFGLGDLAVYQGGRKVGTIRKHSDRMLEDFDAEQEIERYAAEHGLDPDVLRRKVRELEARQ